MQDDAEPGRQAARLRLASARRRAHAFLAEIATLEGSDFPHTDAEDALVEIAAHFRGLLEDTKGLENASYRTIKELCLSIEVSSESYTPVLGFILRSTNVRNAFELYDPLKIIVEKVIGPDTRLIISSEWDFIPFTYPMNLDVLPNYVLVGGPATESSSPLLIPLAGHEIGHSAWAHHGIPARIESAFDAELQSVIEGSPQDAAALEEQFGEGYEGSVREIVFKQLEETFCDCFGLFLFGEAYVFAYEYLKFPGGDIRSLDYPPDQDRNRYLIQAAAWRSLVLAPGIFEGWSDSPDDPHGSAELDYVVDKIVKAMVPQLFPLAAELLNKAEIALPAAGEIKSIGKAFERDVPYAEGGSLANIVTAGWLRLRSRGGLSEVNELVEGATLNETMLKSIEVSEYRRRVPNA